MDKNIEFDGPAVQRPPPRPRHESFKTTIEVDPAERAPRPRNESFRVRDRVDSTRGRGRVDSFRGRDRIDSFNRQCSRMSLNDDIRRQGSSGGFSRQLTQEEAAFHKEKTEIAREVLKKLLAGDETFDKTDGADGLEPPSSDVSDHHFNRRKLANEVLQVTEEYMLDCLTNFQWDVPDAPLPSADGFGRQTSCIAEGYLGQDKVASETVQEALDKAVRDRHYLFKAAAFGEFAPRDDSEQYMGPKGSDNFARSVSTPGGLDLKRLVSSRSVGSSARLSDDGKPASVRHEEIEFALKHGGMGMGRLLPPSHEKPVLKDPVGIRCVAHLHSRKWTKLARHIRDTIYDPDFYDDGTYGPMYVRLAIHGAATYDRHDGSGGLEGGAMRYKPEYSDAHNKFCKEIVKRQDELYKKQFPWASYADIQCLCAYVALECANGPVIEFTPGRRDVIPPKDLKEGIERPEGEDFVLLNYRERGDAGLEDEPVRCPASGNTGDGGCPFLRKMKVPPGRLPGPEQGHLGRCCGKVTKEMEQKEMEAVAEEIRHIFCHRIGASVRHTVALIAGGHSLGRCHPQISGYAGPWQSNPGYFNNVYCKKLISEEWKLVDRNMEDCSGDMITGLKPYGMRRQYVNKNGKGDIMMLVSDMALKDDPQFGEWIYEYALDNEKLKQDFAVAFKWVTELGFDPPTEKPFVEKVKFNLRRWRADFWKWLGETLCADPVPSGGGGAVVVLAADAPKIGKPYTIEEVKAHNSKSDCWVAINGQVCDLTKFLGQHPGGESVIMANAGKDASSEWNAIHSPDAIEKFAPDSIIGYIVASKDDAALGA